MIYDSLTAVESVDDVRHDQIPDWVLQRQQPLVLRGLIKHWPALPKGSGSLDELEQYLSQFWTEQPVTAYVAQADAAGRFGYNEGFNGFNFRSGRAPLRDIFQRLREQQDVGVANPMSIYVGSTPVEGWLPGFLNENSLMLDGEPLINFWLGNQTTVSAHYDFPSNIACVVYGKRRFTLFPTDQVENLYVGPIDRTPSGQPISLVDFDAPDFDRFPKFRKALDHAQTTVLEPGDAIFVPSMWWHHVKALSDCNLLVNYWWLNNPPYLGSPFSALLHSVMSIRHLPAHQRSAWKTLMDHYVFDVEPDAMDHIPEHARGVLGDIGPQDAQRLRNELLNRLKP